MRSKVADALRSEQHAAVHGLSAGQRVHLALELGARDLHAWPPRRGSAGRRPRDGFARRLSAAGGGPAPALDEPRALPIVGVEALVLLKLDAGGPKDGWDIHQLLDARDDRAEIIASVGTRVRELPRPLEQLWLRVVGERS